MALYRCGSSGGGLNLSNLKEIYTLNNTTSHAANTIDVSQYKNALVIIPTGSWNVTSPISATDGTATWFHSIPVTGCGVLLLTNATYISLRSWSYGSSNAGCYVYVLQ